ncbi:TonB-dependent hemin, ferrichrome receptor [Citrobacter freundii]|uniref:TonB-dependent hemin, ferrichrome receptor n=1 Tax=Citrobacter freundii TaxID=546 RepID=A0A7G2IUV1_CITFR|nr:TonB-dependent hemin, ferrichrome receptor [Citrobacter freundii]
MPYLHTASLRPSLLALAIVSNLPAVAYAAVEDMTVTATGNARSAFEAPMMVSVIDATAPENQTASSAADLLRTVPGLTLDGTGRTNGQDVNLRGYDRRGVLVLVDGVRQGTDTGHLNSTFLDPALIKRIEVVRGPSALLYGSGALGGVIAYDTADAKDLLEAGQTAVTACSVPRQPAITASVWAPAHLGAPIRWTDCLPGPAAIAVIYARVTVLLRRMMKQLTICWRKVAGKLTAPRRWPARCVTTTMRPGT